MLQEQLAVARQEHPSESYTSSLLSSSSVNALPYFAAFFGGILKIQVMQSRAAHFLYTAEVSAHTVHW